MTKPPVVALPRGVTRTEFTGAYGPLVGLMTEPKTTPRGSVLLIPGFTGSKEDFADILPVLQLLGWRAATFDLRGQFESPGPDTAAEYSLRCFVDDVRAVASQLAQVNGTPVHLVGHSFGGLVARAAVEVELEGRIAGGGSPLFASLTLLSSGPGALPAELAQLIRLLADALPHTPLQLIWEQKEFAEQGDGRPLPSVAVREFHRQRFVANNPHALRGKALILAEQPDDVDLLAGLLRQMPLPTMVAYGEDDDRWSPSEQDEMARRLGSRRFRWPLTAHSPAAEHPQWCAAALEAFWSDAASMDAASIVDGVTRIAGNAGISGNQVGYDQNMELRSLVTNSPDAVGQARRTIIRQLQAWGLADHADDLALIASELVTNAVRYSSGPIEFVLRTTADSLRLEVHDTNVIDLPAARVAADDEFGGRGVPLVDALSSEWGIDVKPNSKSVWAELPIVDS